MKNMVAVCGLLALTAVLGCSDGGTYPEWRDWEWLTIEGRVSLMIPPDWIGPDYGTYQFHLTHFQWTGGSFLLQQGLTMEFPFYIAARPGCRQTVGVIDGRRVTEMTWNIVYGDERSYNVCLWVDEPDDDYRRYMVVSSCATPDQRETVRRILTRMRFLHPRLGAAPG